MGDMIIDVVLQLLADGGIPAEAAYPGERITRITDIVAAVSLEKADLDARTVTVLVEIFAPQETGGYLCQKKALEACALLEGEGAVVSQGSCEFLSKGHVFRVPIKATFRGMARADDTELVPEFTIKTGNLYLHYAVGFSAKQTLGKEDDTLQNSVWEFTLEEFFPWGIVDTRVAEEPFVLELDCLGNVERYEESIWTSRKRIVEDKGIRQIRTGIAQSQSMTTL